MEQHAINYSLDYSSLDLKTLDFSKNVPEKKESGEAFESKKSFDDYVKEVKNLKDTESRPKEISEKPGEEKLESNENLSEKLSSSDKKRNIAENYKNFSPDELKASKILKESGTVRDKKDLKFEVKSEKKSLENRKKLKLNDERPGNAEKSGEILLKNEKKSDKKTVLTDKIPEEKNIPLENMIFISKGEDVMPLSFENALSSDVFSLSEDEKSLKSDNHKKFYLDKEEKIAVHDFRSEIIPENEKIDVDAKKFVSSVKYDENGVQMQLDLSKSAQENILSLNSQNNASQGSVFQAMLTNQIQENAVDFVKAGQIVLKDKNEGSIKLILHPESLGNVKIDLQISDKVIAGKITVASKEAFNAFKDAQDSLKNAFNQNGFELSGFDLSFQGESSSGQHFFQNQREQENFLRMAEVYSAFSNSESFLSPEIENVSAQVNSSVNIVA